MSDQDRPSDTRDEQPGSSPASLAETSDRLEATMNELIAPVVHHFARRG